MTGSPSPIAYGGLVLTHLIYLIQGGFGKSLSSVRTEHPVSANRRRRHATVKKAVAGHFGSSSSLPRGILALVVFLLVMAALPALPVQSAQVPTGPPAVLAIQSVPPSLPADGRVYQSVVVSVLDVHLNPTLAITPIIISLFSSQPNVASTNATVTIVAGHEYALASLTTTNTPGNTVITAAATGFQSAFVSVNTVTPSGLASSLRVFPSPSTILSNPGESDGIIYIELQDATGLPAKSATEVSVQLSISDQRIVGLSSTNVTIPAGEIFATVNYKLPSSSLGSVTISAFASGFTSGNGGINVVSAMGGNIPCCKVALRGILDSTGQSLLKLPADGITYTALELLLQDAVGDPVRAPSGGILVQLSSSKAS